MINQLHRLCCGGARWRMRKYFSRSSSTGWFACRRAGWGREKQGKKEGRDFRMPKTLNAGLLVGAFATPRPDASPLATFDRGVDTLRDCLNRPQVNAACATLSQELRMTRKYDIVASQWS